MMLDVNRVFPFSEIKTDSKISMEMNTGGQLHCSPQQSCDATRTAL